jgi:hypothetical protein
VPSGAHQNFNLDGTGVNQSFITGPALRPEPHYLVPFTAVITGW